MPFGNAEGQRINLLPEDMFVKAGESTCRHLFPVNSLFGHALPLPQFAQRHGEYALVGQREPVAAGVEQDPPRLEILAAASGQPHKPLPVLAQNRRC